MKKKRICMALAAALSLSLAVSATALAAIPSDIGGHWAQGTIIQWTTNGYISGYPDGTFKPDNSITRAEFVVMVNKAMGYNKRGNAYFSDVSAAHWAYAEIMKGVEAGYITGNGDGTFRPDAPVTRQEAAVMISKILGLGQDFASAAKYADYRYIPSWAAGYVGAVTNAGIMSGYPDRDFKADRVLTRAEAVISLDKTMNYDNKTEEDDREVFEGYRLTSTSLSDKIIKGDLIISSTLSSRDVSLDNVKVEGKLIVDGGKTITADDCEINELEMSKNDAEFVAEGKTTVKETNFEKYGKLVGSGYSKVIIDNEFNSYIELDANIDYVELDADTNVRLLENCVIETFEATKNADSATVNFNKAEVEDMDIYDAIRITGRGDINNMTVYKSGVKSSIRPDHLDRRNGASKPDYTSTSSGDVGYNPGSRYDDLTVSRNNKIYKGGRYDDVKVTADERVTLKDMTIYGDLTIDEDVENGDVYLEDLDIRGRVYIYGGGENTVSFKDCEIEGNIYAKKDHKDTPVGLYIDGDTVENFDGDLYIDDDGAILETGGKLDKVYVLTESKVEIDTDVKNLYVSAKTSKLTITAGTTVDKLSISSNSAKNSTITNNGTVGEIATNYDITVDGSGTVSKDTGDGNVTYEKKVTSVSLNKDTAELTVGGTLQLTAKVAPENATNKNVTWKSSNTDVATVGADGTVTAKAVGEATITVTTDDGGKTATCEVKVSEAQEETIPATGVTLDKETLALTVGGRGTLEATVAPSNTTDELKWTVSDNSENISITENSDGSITVNALKATEENKAVTIVATAGSFSDTCTVTVNPETVTVTEVTIIGAPQESIEVDNTFDLTANVTVEPTGSTYEGEITWVQKSNPTDGEGDVVQITTDETGKATVKALEAGTATITATAGGKEATCTVTVKAKTVEVTGVTIKVNGSESETATMTAGEELQLTAEVVPTEATNKAVTWSSNNKDVATVDGNGKVTAQNVNTSTEVTITATATGGTNIKDTITITVNPKALESITLTTSKDTLTSVNDTATITATANPEGAELGTVNWSITEGNDVVELSENTGESITVTGESITVKAKKSGTAKIKATSGTATGEYTITVNIPVQSVSISAQGGISSPATLAPGGELQLTATVEPSGATNQNVEWISSDTSVTVVNGLVTVDSSITDAKTVTIKAKVGNIESKAFTINVQASTPTTPGEGGNTRTGGTGDDNGDGNQTGGDQNGNTQPGTPGTGEGIENGTQTPGGTTTQATNNAIVVSR